MGYTIYWQRPAELPALGFALAVEDCKKLLAATRVPLTGPEGTGDPILCHCSISFNGRPGCEPFHLACSQLPRAGRPESLSFCKTEGMAYSVCVQVVLIAMKHYLGMAIRVDSDGEESMWDAARNLCQTILGYGANFKRERF